MSEVLEKTDVEAARDRFHAAVGRAVERAAAEAELMTRRPIDSERYVRLVGKLAILERLTAGALVTIELIQEFFGASDAGSHQDDVAPETPINKEQFSESLQRVLENLTERLGTIGDAAQAA